MDVRPRYSFVELSKIETWRTGLVVTLEFDRHIWQVECHAADLWSFRTFQAKVADQLGLWIQHQSQTRPDSRHANWQHAVGVAFSKGTTVHTKGGE